MNVDWNRRAVNAAWVVSMTAMLAMFSSLKVAGFTGDDWHYLALLRHIDSPVDIFTTNIGLSYFYRPITLFVFWLSGSAFGINPIPHYGLNIALHVWVAAEIYECSKRVTARHTLSAWIAGLFLAFPATSATVLWVSNRFDLMATAAMLCSLRLMWTWCSTEKRANQYFWLSLLMAVIALGSKETAFALLPAMLVSIALLRQRARREKITAAFIVFTLAALALVIRFAVLGELRPGQSIIGTITTVVHGTTQLFLILPTALQTQSGHWVLIALSTAVLVLCWPARGIYSLRPVAGPASLLLLPLFVLLVSVVLAQSLITATALSAPNGELATVSLRFYYAPLAILFVIAAAPASRIACSSSRTILVWAAFCMAVIASAIASARQTQAWAANTAAERDQSVAAQKKYAAMVEQQRGAQSACLVQIDGENVVPTDLDLKFKATLDSTDQRVNCVLITIPPQSQSITRIAPCRTEAVLPARPRHAEIPATPRSGTCTYFFLTR